MHIALIGSGHIGAGLARAWSKKGHTLVFEAMDAGPLKNARLLEPLMLLWVNAAQALGTRDLAFKLLRR